MSEYENDLRKAYVKALEGVIKAPYEASSNFGEFVADGLIAYDFLKQMKATNKKLIGIYGENVGAADGTDDYYHPLLQCYLSQISPESQRNGLRLGYGKEIWDYHSKLKKGKPLQEIIQDMRKDLKNNLEGNIIKQRNPEKTCLELLDDKRTENMRLQNLR